MHSQAQDWATILYEASASGNADVISLLLEYGADANIPKHTGHLPIHRVAHHGYVKYEAFLRFPTICKFTIKLHVWAFFHCHRGKYFFVEDTLLI